MVAGEQSTAHGACNEVGDAVMVRERGAQGGALFFAKRGELWVGQLFVLVREVVVALGVADEVDCDCHG